MIRRAVALLDANFWILLFVLVFLFSFVKHFILHDGNALLELLLEIGRAPGERLLTVLELFEFVHVDVAVAEVPFVFLVEWRLLHIVRIQEQELVVLQANEVEGLAWAATHGAHHYVRLMEDVPNGIEVFLFNLVHTKHTVYYNEAAIPVISNQIIWVNILMLQNLLSIIKLDMRIRILQHSKMLFPFTLILYLLEEDGFDAFFF